MTCSKLTWSDLKADTLNPLKAGPKGACSPKQLAIITHGDPCTRLREFNRIAVDVGGGGDCFFRADCHINCTEFLTTFPCAWFWHSVFNPEQFID